MKALSPGRLGMRLTLAFVAALAVLMLNGAISLYNTNALADYQTAVVDRYATLADINRVFVAFDDAETGQRGYLLTGDPAYLAPYRAALRRLPAQFDALIPLLRDDPIQRARLTQLRVLSGLKISELRKTIALQQRGSSLKALRIIFSGRGNRIMRKIRGLITTMEDTERTSLQGITDAARRHNQSTTDTIIVATLANLGLLAFVYVLTNRVIREREQISEERARLLAGAEEARAGAETQRQYAETLAGERSAILGQIADGIAIADREGTLVYVNPMTARFLGTERVGVTFSQHAEVYPVYTLDGTLFPTEELPMMRAVLRGETVIDAPMVIHHPDGTRTVLSATATPLRTVNGVRYGAVCTLRDVTAQRDLALQKEDFLSSIAHDLKTPLTALKGMAQLQVRRLDGKQPLDASRLRDGLLRIDETASRMAGLIEELLDVSRIQMGQGIELNRRSFDLVALVGRRIADFRDGARERSIAFTTSVPVLHGSWDPDRLDRVLVNLLSNADKYSSPGSPIAVSLDVEDDRANRRVAVAVRDWGIGIPAADLPQVFDRFHRGANVPVSTAGTGIGLAGARQIVEHHGGTLTVESIEGAGSTFTMRLPLDTDQVPPEPTSGVDRSATPIG